MTNAIRPVAVASLRLNGEAQPRPLQGRSRAEARCAEAASVEQATAGRQGVVGGFDFLGYHFERGYRWPRQKSLAKFKAAIREVMARTNGQSLERIIAGVNQKARGWFEYFKHSHAWTFGSLDCWIRGRLRSILRQRAGGQGRGQGWDHRRWPNAYFAGLGLFSMAAARSQTLQSARAVNH